MSSDKLETDDQESIETRVAEIKELDQEKRFFAEIDLIKKVARKNDASISTHTAVGIIHRHGSEEHGHSSDELLEACIRAYRDGKERQQRRHERDTHEEWLDETAARDALRHIDAGCSQPEWIRVGFALADHFDRSTAKHLFVEWSRRSSKWGSDAQRQIKSIINDDPPGTKRITVRTLVDKAKNGGWDVTEAAAAGHERRRQREQERDMDRILNGFPIAATWEAAE